MQAVFKKFGKDEQGAVAMAFGLALTAMLFMCGMAMDYARTMNARSRVADAADSAALVAGRALMEGKLTVAEMEKMAAKYFEQNIKGLGTSAVVDRPSVKIDARTGAVTVDVNAHVPMTLTKILGFKSLDFPVTAAAVFKQKDIEIGMALDITGSMRDPSADGTRKIDGLKKAFESFADRLLPDTKTDLQKVRIGFAPYSTSVKLGTRVASLTSGNKNDCLTERQGGSYSDATGQFHNANSTLCFGNDGLLSPLSDNRDALVRQVNSFGTYWGTAGHLGIQWAWNIVSPKWAGFWGGAAAPEGMDRVEEGKLLKAVVIMTDGEFNTQFHGPRSAVQALALCEAMKAEGIVVFSVGFGLGRDAGAIDTLQKCATPGEGYFANAQTSGDLERAFLNFASKLADLRLTK